jgi:hypothetical protein
MTWIEVFEIKQVGDTEFKSVGAPGCNKWMPADGGPGNGGRWLHELQENE